MNKNKKITMAILIGLTTFTMVGCGSQTNNPDETDLAVDVVENDTATDAVDVVENDATTDAVVSDTTEDNKKYSVDDIKADFKIIEDLSVEVAAATVNDSFVAALASTTGVKVSETDLFMGKEIENSKKSVENIKIPQIKKLAEMYINSYKKQSDVIKQLANGEIDESECTSALANIASDLVSDLSEDMEFTMEIVLVLNEHGLLMSDVMDPNEIQTKGVTLAKEKYAENMQNFTKKVSK